MGRPLVFPEASSYLQTDSARYFSTKFRDSNLYRCRSKGYFAFRPAIRMSQCLECEAVGMNGVTSSSQLLLQPTRVPRHPRCSCFLTSSMVEAIQRSSSRSAELLLNPPRVILSCSHKAVEP